MILLQIISYASIAALGLLRMHHDRKKGGGHHE